MEAKPNQESLLAKMQEVEPKSNVLFNAIANLRDPVQIQQFYQEYVGHLESDPTLTEAEKVAQSNIGYAVGYYDQETSKRWLDALPSVAHPVFGRDLPYNSPGRAFEAGKAIGSVSK